MARTFSEIVESLKDYIKFLRSDADTSVGSVLRDLVIDPVANEVSLISTDIDSVKALYSLSNASTMTNEELDNLAYNWSMVRQEGTKAVGEITFQATALPVSTITIGNADGSGGMAVKTRSNSDGTSYIFYTTETVYLTTTTNLNPATGYYEVSADIEAAEIGTVYNVAAATILELVASISGIDYITNKIAVTGGTDEESNTAFADRILTKVTGIYVGTKNGYETLINQNITGLDDVNIVGPNDIEMQRNIYGGSVDIYLLGSNATATSQSNVYDGGEIALTTKPGLTILSVQGISVASGSQWLFRQNIDYFYDLDESSLYGYSTDSVDKLTWLSGVRPVSSSTVTINYTYDKNIVDAQVVVEEDENKLITADVLVKYGQRVGVTIEVDITKLSGYDSDTVESEVITAITDLVNALKLGETLQYSDLIASAHEPEGVDEVGIPVKKIYKTTDPKADYYIQNLTALNTQYLRIDSLIVNVS